MKSLVCSLGAAFLLAGCSDPEAAARHRLEMVKRANGSPAEICKEARSMQEAALQKGDPMHFAEVHNEADIECFDFDHGEDHRLDGVQADNLETGTE